MTECLKKINKRKDNYNEVIYVYSQFARGGEDR